MQLRLFLATALLLAGCASAPAAEPTLQPALGPSTAVAPQPSSPPPPTIVAEQGDSLPGRLLFVQGGNLWLWEGTAAQPLTSSGRAAQPAWSPDGRQIAYVERQTSASDVLVRAADGGAAEQLTANAPDSSVYSYERIYASRWAFYPAWAPDGASLAMASQFGPPGGSPAAEYRMALFSLPSAGGQPAQLYGTSDGHVGRLAYLPDGSGIIFAFEPLGDAPPTLYRYTLATDLAEPLPGIPPQSYDPAISPDGRWLAFARRTDSGTDIFIAPLAGGPPQRLTSLGTARAPTFAPDGSRLAFLAIASASHSFDLWVADLQPAAGGPPGAGEPRQLTHEQGLDADSGLAWAR